MGKGHKHSKGAGAGGGGGGPSSVQRGRPSSVPFGPRGLAIGALGVGIAVMAQLMLTSTSPPPPPSRGLHASSSRPKAAPPTPAVCPDDWKQCPKVAGLDWVALEALAPRELSVEELAVCHEPSSLLSPRPVVGMHLVCVLPPPDGSKAVSTLAVFTRMERRSTPAALLLLPKLKKADHAIAALIRRLQIKNKGPKYQPPALFTETGVRLQSAKLLAHDAAAPRRLLLMEGGQWIWPPVDVGHVHYVKDLTAPGVETRVVTLSLRPLVVEVENFLNPEEAGHIVGRAKVRAKADSPSPSPSHPHTLAHSRAQPHMAKSGVALKDADRGKAAKEFRTSSQYFLPTTRDPILEKVDKRVMYLTRIPISHAEYIQVRESLPLRLALRPPAHAKPLAHALARCSCTISSSTTRPTTIFSTPPPTPPIRTCSHPSSTARRTASPPSSST